MRALICMIALVVAVNIPSFGVDLFPIRIETFNYPLLGVQAQITGDVVVDVSIKRSGEVVQTTLSSGNRVLADAAESALMKWRFAYRCPDPDEPEVTVVRFYFTFKLEGVVDYRPRTRVTYTFPDQVTVIGEAVRVQPATRTNK